MEITKEKKCLVCGKTVNLECHHIFGGFANRKLSEEDGLKVWLCHEHHNEPPYGVHYNKEFMLALRKAGQEIYEIEHTREEFIKRYGRNYL